MTVIAARRLVLSLVLIGIATHVVTQAHPASRVTAVALPPVEAARTVDQVVPGGGTAESQQAVSSFEAASVRLMPPSSAGGVATVIGQLGFVRIDGNRFRAENMTVARLIAEAYGAEYPLRNQLQDGPDWIDQDRFRIEAVAPGSWYSREALPAAVRGMLRDLLATRFNLRVRSEMRDERVYVLVRANEEGLEAGLRPSKDDCTTTSDSRPGEPGFRAECLGELRIDGISMRGRPMDELVRFLRTRLNRHVIDETALTGNFDIELRYEVPPALGIRSLDAVAEFSAGIFTAVREDLGLKLETTVRPVPVLVIEHIDRPAPN